MWVLTGDDSVIPDTQTPFATTKGVCCLLFYVPAISMAKPETDTDECGRTDQSNLKSTLKVSHSLIACPP